jgi:hypothetical protein
MNKISLIIFIVSLCGCSIQKSKKPTDDIPIIQACNLYNDTVNFPIKNKVTILVFINEPTCTGCKENLAKYLNTLSKKYNQYIILGKSESILDKKGYSKYLDFRFKKSSGTYYSLINKNLSIKVNNKEYSFSTSKNPFTMVITDNGKTIDVYEYQDIFENIFIKKTFKQSIKKY